MPTRTIAYLRVSTDKQAVRGVSLDAPSPDPDEEAARADGLNGADRNDPFRCRR
jgi:hypothetical protein